MSIAKTALGSFAAGAALMYFADPSRGKRRRNIVRDKLNSGLRSAAREFDKAGRDLRNRSEGLVSSMRTLTSRAEADEPVIEERVRAAIGHVVSRPHAISVTAQPGGRITLEGTVSTCEEKALMKRVEAVHGVRAVVNRMERREDAANGRTGSRQRWTPVVRVSAATLGATALMSGLRNDGFRGMVGTVAGSVLLTRALANRGFNAILGIGGKGVIEFDKTIHILAPVEEVFAFWSKPENFPRFMSHLKEVRDLGNRRSHWVAEGPGGIGVSWDAETIQFKKNQRLGWRSVAGSKINTEGIVRFSEGRDGGTTVSIHMCYCPPAGVIGHGVAWLFGIDPKSEMNDDLGRLKSLLEIGKTRAHGNIVRREEFATSTT